MPASPDVDAWPWPIKIYALGGFRVLKAGEEIRFARKTQKKPLELLRGANRLWRHRTSAVSALTESLWPDAEGDAAYHAFRKYAYRCASLLGSADVVNLSGGKLSLDPRRCWVDVWALERRLDQARGRRPVLASQSSRRVMNSVSRPFSGTGRPAAVGAAGPASGCGTNSRVMCRARHGRPSRRGRGKRRRRSTSAESELDNLAELAASRPDDLATARWTIMPKRWRSLPHAAASCRRSKFSVCSRPRKRRRLHQEASKRS